MSTTYDAVIVGAGHNGLVCGAYLARAGRKVCVLERRALIGGASVTEEVWPGFKVSTEKVRARSNGRGAQHTIWLAEVDWTPRRGLPEDKKAREVVREP